MEYQLKPCRRRSIRLKDYDYSQRGAYFITICTRNRKYLFGDVVDTQVQLNSVGEMIQNIWTTLPEKIFNIEISEFIVMPNHIHGIIYLVGAGLVSARDGWRKARSAPTIGDVVCAFKSFATNEYIHRVKLGEFPPFKKTIWQRNYYEHVIRNDEDMDRVYEYIITNPHCWKTDEFFSPNDFAMF